MLLDSKPVRGLKQVVTLDELRRDFARFEQRRQLLDSHDLFLADDRILPMLTKALGKTFLARKRQPIPLKVTGKDLARMAARDVCGRRR
jgi:ribosome biogenesis protein UTP30